MTNYTQGVFINQNMSYDQGQISTSLWNTLENQKPLVRNDRGLGHLIIERERDYDPTSRLQIDFVDNTHVPQSNLIHTQTISLRNPLVRKIPEPIQFIPVEGDSYLPRAIKLRKVDPDIVGLPDPKNPQLLIRFDPKYASYPVIRLPEKPTLSERKTTYYKGLEILINYHPELAYLLQDTVKRYSDVKSWARGVRTWLTYIKKLEREGDVRYVYETVILPLEELLSLPTNATSYKQAVEKITKSLAEVVQEPLSRSNALTALVFLPVMNLGDPMYGELTHVKQALLRIVKGPRHNEVEQSEHAIHNAMIDVEKEEIVKGHEHERKVEGHAEAIKDVRHLEQDYADQFKKDLVGQFPEPQPAGYDPLDPETQYEAKREEMRLDDRFPDDVEEWSADDWLTLHNMCQDSPEEAFRIIRNHGGLKLKEMSHLFSDQDNYQRLLEGAIREQEMQHDSHRRHNLLEGDVFGTYDGVARSERPPADIQDWDVHLIVKHYSSHENNDPTFALLRAFESIQGSGGGDKYDQQLREHIRVYELGGTTLMTPGRFIQVGMRQHTAMTPVSRKDTEIHNQLTDELQAVTKPIINQMADAVLQFLHQYDDKESLDNFPVLSKMLKEVRTGKELGKDHQETLIHEETCAGIQQFAEISRQEEIASQPAAAEMKEAIEEKKKSSMDIVELLKDLFIFRATQGSIPEEMKGYSNQHVTVGNDLLNYYVAQDLRFQDISARVKPLFSGLNAAKWNLHETMRDKVNNIKTKFRYSVKDDWDDWVDNWQNLINSGMNLTLQRIVNKETTLGMKGYKHSFALLRKKLGRVEKA
jgi:hypothetical protein